MNFKTLTIKVTRGPKGQQRSKWIQVEQYFDLTVALKRRNLVGENGKLTDYGKEYVSQAISFLYRRNMESRGGASLFPITISGIFEVAKKDPEVRYRLNLLLSELDLPQLQV